MSDEGHWEACSRLLERAEVAEARVATLEGALSELLAAIGWPTYGMAVEEWNAAGEREHAAVVAARAVLGAPSSPTREVLERLVDAVLRYDGITDTHARAHLGRVVDEAIAFLGDEG